MLSLPISVPLSSGELRSAVSFPFRLSSVKLLPGAITGSRFSSVSSPVSPLSSSNPCPMIILFMLSIICLRSLSSPTNLAAFRHPLKVNAQAPLLISVQDLVQPELSNCIQLLQLAHTKFLLDGGLFFGGILRSTDSIDGIALKKAVFSPGFPPGEMFYTFHKSSISLL